MSKLILSKPIEIDGELKKEIEYDLDSLTGSVIENAIKDLQKNNYVPTVQETDQLLHANIFAQAAGLDHMDIKRLSIKDYIKVTGIVRDFFISDLVVSQQENICEK